eukprot:TRINITY_DN17881_c0_g1_i3.p1 TRINITY_DN17881_c0_g1~~TRINITY_DN17881_c0_g1_i3.p1  ORF type:complete len:255 (-),score=48.62 TRINITY_DN17881_c0_g1_i3:63-827(-)
MCIRDRYQRRVHGNFTMGECCSRDKEVFKKKYKERYLKDYHSDEIEEDHEIIQEQAMKPQRFLDTPQKKPRIREPRFLRIQQPKMEGMPSLGELEQSPWKFNPRDSYREIMDQRVRNSQYSGMKENSSLYPFTEDERLVNVEQSAELGELNDFAKDSALFHPDYYEDDPVPKSSSRSHAKNILMLGEELGKGVFSPKEMGSSQMNPLMHGDSVDQKEFQSLREDNGAEATDKPKNFSSKQMNVIGKEKKNSKFI